MLEVKKQLSVYSKWQIMKNSQIHKKVFDFLSKLPPKQKAQISIKILELFNNPKPIDSIQMKGEKNYFRVDIGEYRIVYTFINDELYIELVGKRNDGDVYKKMN